MKSIKKTVTSEITINKSVFLNYLVPVSSVEEAKQTMVDLRKKYNDANHHCYAYIIGEHQEIQKFSDDGEPSKTAGMPMIEVLKKQNLTNILTVSIRYFGGIKLGAGGLVRAYTKSVSEAIKDSEFSTLTAMTELMVTVPFDHIGHVEKYIRDNYNLVNTEYLNNVKYFIETETCNVEKISNDINEKTKGSGICDIIREYQVYK